MSLLENKKAYFDYEIQETFEAGIELLGFEVKALRGKLGSLEGSHVVVRGGEAFLTGATIPPYQPANTPKDYDPHKNRKLLLTKKEIGELGGYESKKGLTLIPISVYNKNNRIKILVGVARAKKKHDKRETIKRRETEREMRRSLKD
ncbi:MAG: SsrA-binding protein [Candidatus Zambryskibacteria bacterium RIFCSPHIGHO2_01_FULL_43_25]|uniref:SsrA-binding protein n=1 Tax=Candidatus Zambryskibacteria bacterium RIFCSPLOWO2_01_FULL_45_21 TaxID=1802761 RepID=A0A1G2U4P2_9BACT|nr:MAG: SsrA-binding protein [Candidatus Zambryskibacteria bacterium RIFCSPHIGHO2_01_FULL_43_25]OHB00634.1 MAG: SsrA-binding protein [Candidatus Zambryskibacteria bacterium RIFCSPHIGHO2_12_FULL_44_12b]OHB04449.1 MAG: SsrA-binding protein [Candidatus Zambryskibacteria bacterium RIFCSPLOWO2_01_FULL_45_21]